MPDYALSNAMVSASIDEWIPNEKHRAIMKRRLCDGLTYAKIAEEFDMSDRQIKRIIYKNQDKLFGKLNIKVDI